MLVVVGCCAWQATAPVLAEHGTTITSTFYGIMFEEFPQVKQFFNFRNQSVS
jgi:nitric oxide dioxygenase